MILVILFKDLKLFFKSTGAMIITFLVPMVLIFIFGSVFTSSGNGSINAIRVVLVDNDNSASSKKFTAILDSLNEIRIITKYKENKKINTFTSQSLDNKVKKGKQKIGIIISKGFSKAIKNGDSPKIKIHYDPKYQVEYGIVSGVTQKILMNQFPQLLTGRMFKKAEEFLGNNKGEKFKSDIQNTISSYFSRKENIDESNKSEIGSEELVDLETKKLVGEKLKNPMFAQSVAGIAVMFLLFSLSRAGSSILEEKSEGTLDRLLIAPIKPYTIILAKLIFSSLLGIFQLIVMFIFGWIIFGLEIFSHIPALSVMIIVTSLAASSLGMLIAAISRNQSQVNGLTTLIALGMSALGGSMFPSFIMPNYLQTIGKFTLNHWAMEGMTNVFWRNMSIRDISSDIYVLISIFVVFSSISIYLFNKRFFQK